MVVLAWPSPFFHAIRRWWDLNLQLLFNAHLPVINILLAGFLAFALVCCALIIHELGHLWMGRAVGFRWKYFRIGPFQLDHSLKFSRGWPSEMNIWGMATFFPEEMKGHRWRFILMVLAGPVTNIATGSIALLLPLKDSLPLGTFITVSLYFGATNLLPIRFGRILSDGGKIMRAVFRNTSHERSLALAMLVEEMGNGEKPELLSRDLVEEATALREDSLDTVLAYLLAFSRAYSLKENSTAEQCLETCLQYSGRGTPAIRAVLIGNAAIFQAYRRNRIDLALQWLADMPDDEAGRLLRPKIEAGLAKLQSNVTQPSTSS